MTTPLEDAFTAFKNSIIANPSAVNTLVGIAATDLVAAKVPRATFQATIATKTQQRDQLKTQANNLQATLAAYNGATYTRTVTFVGGSKQATITAGASPDDSVLEGGWISATLRAAPGSLVTDVTGAVITMSKVASGSGSATATIKTGSLALQAAQAADLAQQVTTLQAQVDAITSGADILADISDGRAALVSAGHYLAPRTITSGAAGSDPSVLTNETTALQTFMQTTVGNGTSGVPKWAHLWRNQVYRSDGQITLTSKNWWRLDQHGSRLRAAATGSATRVQLSIEACTNFLVRPAIWGSLPTGAPAFDATYSPGQHGLQILGGSDGVIEAPDITSVYGSGVRLAHYGGTVKPVRITVQGVGFVDRCGNHALAVTGVDTLEWRTCLMGATGRDTIAISPTVGVVCNGVNLHNFRIIDAITDTSKVSISSHSGGKVTAFTIDSVTTLSAHGPLTGDLNATTSGQPHKDVAITNNNGAGALVNTDRAAFLATNILNLTYSGNTQQMSQVSGADVMYGLKGATISGTTVVQSNALANSVAEALIAGVLYPQLFTIDSPTSLGPFTEGTPVSGGVQFTTVNGTGTVTWSHSIPSGGNALPSGITFSAGGLLTVNPATGTHGSFTHRFTATDSAVPANTTYVDLTFSVVASGATLAITTTGPLNFVKGTDATVSLAATGGTGPYHWSLASGTLPSGYVLDDDGTLHVTGATILVNSGFSRTFKVTDSAGTPATDTKSITIVVTKPATVGAWPPQDVMQGRGVTVNAADWQARMDGLLAKLTANGLAAMKRGGCRIEVRLDSMEPTAGTYAFTTGITSVSTNKVKYLKAKGIPAYLTFSYYQPFYVAPIVTQLAVSRVNTGTTSAPKWRARLTGNDLDFGGGAKAPPSGGFVGIHVRVNGVTAPALVQTMGGGAGSTVYVTLDKDVTDPTSIPSGPQTATFGPYPGCPYAEQDRHMGVDPTHMNDVATAITEYVAYCQDTLGAQVIVGGFNETNGQFRRPSQDVDVQTKLTRFIYRAVKEYDPTVKVILDSVSMTDGTDTNSWSVGGVAYLKATWQAMKADTTWPTWITKSTATATRLSKSTNNLAALLAAGTIDPNFFVDGFDAHTYGWTRIGAQTEGADNIGHWKRANNSIAVKWVQILNDLYDEDPSASKNTLAHMKGCSGETGVMWDPRARTGVGLLVADAPEIAVSAGGPGPVPSTASYEEAYVHDTFVFQLVDQHINWPTGGTIPVYKGPKADPNEHWMFVSMQRLSEEDETYSGAATFYSQGYYNRAGVLKQSTKTTRANLNSGIYSNANIGSGVDKIDALTTAWNT